MGLAVTNNNPGNLRDPSTGSFRQFKSPQEGYAALLNDLQAKQNGTTTTGLGPSSSLVDFASKYAPANDKNNVGQYAANLANKMGTRPDAKLKDLDLAKWAAAVSSNEDNSSPFGKQKILSSNTAHNAPSTDVPAPQLGQGQQGSFLGDVGKTATDAATGVSNAVSDTLTGKINPLSGVLQGVGAIAGGVGGLTNNLLEHTPILGGVYKGVEGLIGQGVGALANTNVGKGLVSNYQGFAQAHPELAGDINAGIDVASALPILKGLGVAKTAIKGGVSSALKGSVEKAAAEALGGTAPKLADVKAGIKKGLIKQGKNGPVLEADPAKALSQKYLAEEMKTGGLAKNAAPEQIATHAENAANTEAKNLESLLSKSEIQHIVQPEDLQGLIDRTVERAGTSATSGENPAQLLMKVFTDKLPKGRDILPVDILKARRAVGAFIRENKGDWSQRGVLTGFKSARNAFWDESRDLLAKIAPDVPVIPSLEKQAALYRVSDYIAPKVKKSIVDASKSTFMTRHPVIRGLVKAGGKVAIEGTGVGAALRIMQ